MTFQPENRWLNLNGVKLHYLDWGNTSAPPMILLHGFCSYARYWDFFARNMKSHYHILALDMRGHGESDWAETYSLRDGAADLAGLVDALKLKNIILIGLSLGGLMSMLYAAENSESLSRLIIVDIGPELNMEGLAHIAKDLASEPECFASAEEAFSRLKQVQPLNSDEVIRHQVAHALKRCEDKKLRFKYDPALCRLNLESPEWLWGHLKRIKCPTLVIRAEHSDVLSEATARRMIALLPQGSLTEIPDTTHTLVGDNPEAFEQVVRKFLKPENK